MFLESNAYLTKQWKKCVALYNTKLVRKVFLHKINLSPLNIQILFVCFSNECWFYDTQLSVKLLISLAILYLLLQFGMYRNKSVVLLWYHVNTLSERVYFFLPVAFWVKCQQHSNMCVVICVRVPLQMSDLNKMQHKEAERGTWSWHWITHRNVHRR